MKQQENSDRLSPVAVGGVLTPPKSTEKPLSQWDPYSEKRQNNAGPGKKACTVHLNLILRCPMFSQLSCAGVPGYSEPSSHVRFRDLISYCTPSQFIPWLVEMGSFFFFFPKSLLTRVTVWQYLLIKQLIWKELNAELTRVTRETSWGQNGCA